MGVYKLELGKKMPARRQEEEEEGEEGVGGWTGNHLNWQPESHSNFNIAKQCGSHWLLAGQPCLSSLRIYSQTLNFYIMDGCGQYAVISASSLLHVR